jgi:hypothetical protein
VLVPIKEQTENVSLIGKMIKRKKADCAVADSDVRERAGSHPEAVKNRAKYKCTRLIPTI